MRKFLLITLTLTIFFSLFSTYISPASCGSYLAVDSSSCIPYSTNTTLCCLLTANFQDIYISSCYAINYTDYFGLNDQIVLGNYTYEIDCGQVMGSTCGSITTPRSYKDCGQAGTTTNACCYYEYKNDTSCMWLGSPYVGQLEYNGLTLICNADILVFRYYLYVFIAIIFVLF